MKDGPFVISPDDLEAYFVPPPDARASDVDICGAISQFLIAAAREQQKGPISVSMSDITTRLRGKITHFGDVSRVIETLWCPPKWETRTVFVSHNGGDGDVAWAFSRPAAQPDVATVV